MDVKPTARLVAARRALRRALADCAGHAETSAKEEGAADPLGGVRPAAPGAAAGVGAAVREGRGTAAGQGASAGQAASKARIARAIVSEPMSPPARILAMRSPDPRKRLETVDGTRPVAAV